MTMTRKFGAYMLIVFVALGIVGGLTGRVIRDNERDQITRTLDAVARLESRRVDDQLAASASRLQNPTIEAVFADVIDAHDVGDAPVNEPVGDQSLDDIIPYLPSLRAATLLAADGAPIAHTSRGGAPQPLDEAFLEDAAARIEIGAPYVVGRAFRIAPGDERYVQVVPIESAGRTVGFVVAESDLSAVQRLLSRSSVLGDSAEAHLVQETADGAAQFITDLRFADDARFARTVPLSESDSPAIVALQDDDGTYGGLTDYRGRTVVASVQQVPNTSWSLVVKIDEAEMYGALNRAMILGGIAFAAAGLAALVLIGFLFRSILARIGRISASAAAISGGDLTSRVSDHSPDELGRLARAFDRMTDTLVSDMARRHDVERQLAHRANHDPLTGLPNRDAFQAGLRQALQDRPIPGTVAALFCDLDDFKTVNDDLGHSAGDALLVGVAQRLKTAVGPDHLLARFGGDEFVIVARHVLERGQVARLAERIREQLASPIVLAGRDVYVTTSIGVAFSRAGSSAETLIRDADAAMYRAKEVGRHRVVVHDESIGARAANRLGMTTELRRAIANGSLTMALQPIIDLETRATRGWEALVRWVHEGREVDPAEFVTRATELDIAGELDRWVLSEACRIMRRLEGRTSVATGWLHVNVTGTSLVDSDFSADALKVLADHGVAPSALCLEIIEDRLGTAPHLAFRTLNELRRHGVHIAIDDFGTGHSSLARLRDLPIDVVKIDQSFVRDVVSDPTVEAITSTIVALTKRLGLEAIAEGVETEDQVEVLRRLGCRYAQGYLLATPQPAEDVVRLVTAH
ncbi:MAG: putative bifunctional diguanylate cyclase/phosphodiesterase [Acidimicrobiia bacterium]